MINLNDIEKAVEYLRDNAEPAAQARANRLHLEEYRKSLKASLMLEHMDRAVNAQEREAYADPRYIEFLEAYKEAVYIDEKFRYLTKAAEAKIQAWQTQEATRRKLDMVV